MRKQLRRKSLVAHSHKSIQEFLYCPLDSLSCCHHVIARRLKRAITNEAHISGGTCLNSRISSTMWSQSMNSYGFKVPRNFGILSKSWITSRFEMACIIDDVTSFVSFFIMSIVIILTMQLLMSRYRKKIVHEIIILVLVFMNSVTLKFYVLWSTATIMVKVMMCLQNSGNDICYWLL